METKIAIPADRVLPTPGKPGPVTAMAELQPGETGSDALARIGSRILPTQGKGGGAGRPRKLPRQLAAILALRTEGMGTREIAERLSMSPGTVSKILQKARRDHGFDDLADRVKNRAIPAAVDNLVEYLERGDRDMTQFALKSTIFKQEKGGVVDAGQSNVLVVKIEMPAIPANAPTVAVGAISGTPQRMKPQIIQGDVVDAV